MVQVSPPGLTQCLSYFTSGCNLLEVPSNGGGRAGHVDPLLLLVIMNGGEVSTVTIRYCLKPGGAVEGPPVFELNGQCIIIPLQLQF